MAHDFAKQRAARAKNAGKPATSGWLWLVSGVVIGALISFLVYLATLAPHPQRNTCLLYTSDAADERSSVDLGGRRIIKKKKM